MNEYIVYKLCYGSDFILRNSIIALLLFVSLLARVNCSFPYRIHIIATKKETKSENRRKPQANYWKVNVAVCIGGCVRDASGARIVYLCAVLFIQLLFIWEHLIFMLKYENSNNNSKVQCSRNKCALQLAFCFWFDFSILRVVYVQHFRCGFLIEYYGIAWFVYLFFGKAKCIKATHSLSMCLCCECVPHFFYAHN